MIAIIDYDVGNLGAVANMFRRLGAKCAVSDDKGLVAEASGIVLPGNGSFDTCMRNFNESGLREVVERRVKEDGIPLLGICVGAQMMGRSSDEGILPGLGWINMHTRRFPNMEGLRVPNMGWNRVRSSKPHHPLARTLEQSARFYFIHSYYLDPVDPADILFEAHYGINFAAGVSKGGISGVQFHPEKSHRYGKQLLGAFVGLC